MRWKTLLVHSHLLQMTKALWERETKSRVLGRKFLKALVTHPSEIATPFWQTHSPCRPIKLVPSHAASASDRTERQSVKEQKKKKKQTNTVLAILQSARSYCRLSWERRLHPLHRLGPVLLDCCRLQLTSLSSVIVLLPPLLCKVIASQCPRKTRLLRQRELCANRIAY